MSPYRTDIKQKAKRSNESLLNTAFSRAHYRLIAEEADVRYRPPTAPSVVGRAAKDLRPRNKTVFPTRMMKQHPVSETIPAIRSEH